VATATIEVIRTPRGTLAAEAPIAPDVADSRWCSGLDRREGGILLVEATATPSCTPLGQAVIDCDIHNAVPSVQALFPYLSEHWREYITQSAFNGTLLTWVDVWW